MSNRDENEALVEKKQIKDYLEEIQMPALRKNIIKLYDDIEEKLKSNPASIKYHHDYPSGLYVHTLEVMRFAVDIFDLYKEEFTKYFTRDDVILVAFIHDLEKLNKYKVNTSARAGTYEPLFTYNYGKLDMNDSAEVARLTGQYGIHLTDMQLHGVCLHMGGYTIGKGKMTPLSSLIHSADLLSTYIGEIKL